MSNIDTLKTELENQRDIIVEKGGVMTVANDYPSPFEITDGIKSLTTPDFRATTATEADVALGKTFYSQTSEMKTGTAVFDPNMIHNIFMTDYKTQTTEETVYYSCPSGLKAIRQYCFYNNYNPIHFTFNPDLETINQYAFYNARNMSFSNFNEHTNLKNIEQYSFANASVEGIEFGSLPESITKLETYSFYNVSNANFTILKFPDNITKIGTSVFMQQSRTIAGGLDLSNYKFTSLYNGLVYYIAFNGDCIIPEGVQTISAYFNYNGCFRNIELPASLTRLDNMSFGADSLQSISNFYLNSVTFKTVSPPKCGSDVFAAQNIENGFKIYVPDESIEEYKAVENLSAYINYIYPVSQKE